MSPANRCRKPSCGLYFILSLILLIAVPPVTASEAPDIRHRAVIYFLPGKARVDDKQLPQYLDDFRYVKVLPKSAKQPSVSYRLSENFMENFPPPDLKYLSYFGRGVSKEQAQALQQTRQALIIDFAYPYALMSKGLKQSDNVIYAIAHHLGGLIWDSETRELFTPASWHEKQLKAWQGAIPIVEKHIVIHAYRSDEGIRAISLGMAKFGMPDIVVNNFSWSQNKSMGNLVNLVAQSIVEGARLSKDDILHIDIDKLEDTPYKAGMIDSLKDNASRAIDLHTGEAKWEEGDPDNYLLEILFDNVEGDSLHRRQEVLLSSLFGWEDDLVYVKHNLEILAARDRARAQLPKLRKAFNNGLSPGEFILLKAPFKTPKGGNEWMWVEVLSWKGKSIRGLLKNEPYLIPDLHGGDEVSVNQDEVFDYIRNYADGRSEGNETSALIEKYQTEKN